jgi:hypothetical protein
MALVEIFSTVLSVQCPGSATDTEYGWQVFARAARPYPDSVRPSLLLHQRRDKEMKSELY